MDARSDEEDTGAAPAEPGPDASSQELNLSIYSAAAGPFKTLLARIGQAPGMSYLSYHAATVSMQFHMLAASACVLCSKSQPITHNTTILAAVCWCLQCCKSCLKHFQVKPAVVDKVAVALQACLPEQVQTGHTFVVWCCSAFGHACMFLKAIKVVKKQAHVPSSAVQALQ